MSVEEWRVRTHAQGMQAQQHLLQQFPRVQAAIPVIHQFIIDERIQVRENGIVLRRKPAEVCFL